MKPSPNVSIESVNDVFFAAVDRDLPRAILFKRKVKWHSISSRNLYRYVVGVARALESWGIEKGDRVAIVSENRPEWAMADFACMLIGAVVVPIYPTLTAEQTLVLLNDAGARVVFVSTRDQQRKVASILARSGLEKVVAMHYNGTPNVIPMSRLMHNGPTERDPAMDARARSLNPDDVATIVYTSGATGVPKGALLTQRGLAVNLSHCLDFRGLRPGQIGISLLPLSSVTARHLDYALFLHGVTVAYCPFPDELRTALREVKPHFLAAMPQIYEKLYDRIQCGMGAGGKRRLYDWAFRVGQRHREEVLAGRKPSGLAWKLAEASCFRRIRHELGGRLQTFLSSGAPLRQELLEWYASMGIRIYEGYGLAETATVVALNSSHAYRAGSVGRPRKDIEVRLSPEGEILVKGPCMFQGYWGMPEATLAAWDGEWLRTGDLGRLDGDGFLYITGGARDLIATPGSKLIYPHAIESRLKGNLLVAEAIVVADRRKAPCAIVAPDFSALESWARLDGIPANGRKSLLAHPRVHAQFQNLVSTVNGELASFEKIKKLLLVEDEFTVANGALTPTMKLRRGVIAQRYWPVLDELLELNAGPTDSVTNAA